MCESWSWVPPTVTVLAPPKMCEIKVVYCAFSSVSKKHGKLITFLRSFMKSRPTKQKLKQRGILRERVFGCDLGEHLLNSGHDGEWSAHFLLPGRLFSCYGHALTGVSPQDSWSTCKDFLADSLKSCNSFKYIFTLAALAVVLFRQITT